MRSILHMYCQRWTSKGSPSKKPQNWKFNERQRTRMERMQKRYEGEEKKTKKGKEKRGSKGVSPCALQTQIFQKKGKEKINGWKEQRRNNRSFSVCIWTFYKISLGHFKTRSKSLSRALLQFEHTNAQHTGIWWLLRPTFCQAAPFVIIPHWRCYYSHSLEWACDRLEISVHTNFQSSHL